MDTRTDHYDWADWNAFSEGWRYVGYYAAKNRADTLTAERQRRDVEEMLERMRKRRDA